MSHDKKKSKKQIEGAHVPVEAVSVIANGSGNAKTGDKIIVPETKIAPKKAPKWKTR